MEKNQPKKVTRLMIRPIVSSHFANKLTHFVQYLIFKFFQTKSRVEVWLHDNNDLRIEGQIIVSTSLSALVLTLVACVGF